MLNFVALLLPCIASGYLLANAILAMLLGLLWLALYDNLAPRDWQICGAAAAWIKAQWFDLGPEKVSKFLVDSRGVDAVFMALVFRILTDLATYLLYHLRIAITSFDLKDLTFFRILFSPFLLLKAIFSPFLLLKAIQRLQILMLSCKGRELECFFFSHASEPNLAIFTLDNDKIYVGWPVASRWTSKSPEWLRIIPLVSGHRHSNINGKDDGQRKVTLTTFYTDDSNHKDLKKDAPNDDSNQKDLKKDASNDDSNQKDLKKDASNDDNSGIRWLWFFQRVSCNDEWVSKQEMIMPVKNIVSFQRFHPELHKQPHDYTEKAGTL